MTTDRKATIRAALIDVLCKATGDAVVTREELRAAGIGRQWRGGIVNASYRIASDVDAVNVADEYAELIATHDAEVDALTTDQIVNKIGRL